MPTSDTLKVTQGKHYKFHFFIFPFQIESLWNMSGDVGKFIVLNLRLIIKLPRN